MFILELTNSTEVRSPTIRLRAMYYLSVETVYTTKRSKRKFLMQLTYKYRLKPTKAQIVTIAIHLETLS